ncbi:MAG: glycosyltransferase family 4 protein [Spirochaetales bacterium]|nr:glycosyltransferase family 4 protein [Spirochaetales bacterium]
MAKERSSLHIGFVSTRFAGTDGVTLESAKWAKIFENFGHRCYWYAGVAEKPADCSMTVPEAFFNEPRNRELNEVLFGSQQRERAVTDEIYRRKEYIKDTLYQFIGDFSIDMIVAENCLSIPMHIPLGVALTELIAETKIPTIGHHHDLWWERPRFLLSSIRDIIQASFPPDLPSIRHVVINSTVQTDLASKRGLSSSVVYNVIDFDSQQPALDDFNRDFRESLGFDPSDLLILQPTRVISRKGIEHSLYLVKKLQIPSARLIISHTMDDEGSDYGDWILETAKQQNVPLHLIYNRLHETRKYSDDGEKLYTLWDVYPHANLVTYPSLYEGFGNAFLEAVYYRKPILLNRYSVYITDIEPKGFDVITIDGFLTERAVEQTREILLDPERRAQMTTRNFEIAKKYFSYRVLRRRLSSLLYSFYGEL